MLSIHTDTVIQIHSSTNSGVRVSFHTLKKWLGFRPFGYLLLGMRVTPWQRNFSAAHWPRYSGNTPARMPPSLYICITSRGGCSMSVLDKCTLSVVKSDNTFSTHGKTNISPEYHWSTNWSYRTKLFLRIHYPQIEEKRKKRYYFPITHYYFPWSLHHAWIARPVSLILLVQDR